jgi:hypothetical protein
MYTRVLGGSGELLHACLSAHRMQDLLNGL